MSRTPYEIPSPESVSPGWGVAWSDDQRIDERGWETLLCLANGYVGLRGSRALAAPGREPAALFAGVYDKPDRSDDAGVYGLTIRNKAITPSFAIAPLWNLVSVHTDAGCVDFLTCRAAAVDRVLDLARGLLIERYDLVDRLGRTTRFRQCSLVSMADRHTAFVALEVEALDYDGQAQVRFGLDQDTSPAYIPRLRDYTSRTDLVGSGQTGEAVHLLSRVSETGTTIALAAQTRLAAPAGSAAPERPDAPVIERTESGLAELFVVRLVAGEPVRFDRHVAFRTSRDCEEPLAAALGELERETARGPATAVERHVEAVRSAWADCEISFEGDDEALLGTRWCVFNLLQTANPNDPDVSIGATGLAGQGYFGHVFWDTEIFMLPFYILTNPQAARSLLLYRARRLDAARTLAAAIGLDGAKFPWTSAGEGFDATPPDWERCATRQIHISGDVAYAFMNYLRWTGDREFHTAHGVEVIVETAKFYAGKTVEGDDGRFHLPDVLGPDEYHLHANDNYYTNHLVRWNLRAAVAEMDLLAASPAPADAAAYERIAARTGWSAGWRAKLVDRADRLAFPEVRDGVCEQYDGFFDLPDVEPFERDEFTMPITAGHHYGRETMMSKQADAVMALFLFPDDFSPETTRATYAYYDRRCNQASSLSPSVFSVVGLAAGLDEHAYGYFRLTSLLDLKNLHLDKNLGEGIHIACAGGTWCALVFGFGGVRLADDVLCIDPKLPPRWTSMEFAIHFRGCRLRVHSDGAVCSVALEEGDRLEVRLRGQVGEVRRGRAYTQHMQRSDDG